MIKSIKKMRFYTENMENTRQEITCIMSDFIAKGLESIDFTRISAHYLIV